ncbi:hypothetical protein T439DRAFT_358230 [Meredithblackwellia eburnea MCA 4105]
MDQSKLVEFNGPIVAAALIYFALFGMACSQTFDYFAWYQTSSHHRLRIWIPTLWFKSISGWGDPASVFATDISGNLLNLTTVLIVCPSQVFFASIAYRGELLPTILILERTGRTTSPKPIGRNIIFLVCISVAIALVFVSGIALCYELLFMNKNWLELPKALPQVYLICDNTNHGLLGQAPGLLIAGIVICSLLHTLNARKQLQVQVTKSLPDANSAFGGGSGPGGGPGPGAGNRESRFGMGNSAIPLSRRGKGLGMDEEMPQITVNTIVLRETDEGFKTYTYENPPHSHSQDFGTRDLSKPRPLIYSPM